MISLLDKKVRYSLQNDWLAEIYQTTLGRQSAKRERISENSWNALSFN
ncbi:hypothetical protein [Peribacillus simplex]